MVETAQLNVAGPATISLVITSGPRGTHALCVTGHDRRQVRNCLKFDNTLMWTKIETRLFLLLETTDLHRLVLLPIQNVPPHVGRDVFAYI